MAGSVWEMICNDCADLFQTERAAQSALVFAASVFAAGALLRARGDRFNRRNAFDRDGVEFWDAEIAAMESALARLVGEYSIAELAAMWETELPLFGGHGSVVERVVF